MLRPWPMVVLLSLALLPGAAARMEAPTLAPGDGWEWVEEGADENGTYARRVVETVEAAGAHEVNGTRHDALLVVSREVRSRPNATAAPIFESRTWLRASDLATLERWSWDNATAGGPIAVHGFADPPCPTRAPYPLEVGRVVSFDCRWNFVEEDGSLTPAPYSWELHVLRTERVRVPAGEFDAYVVGVPDGEGGWQLTHLASEACGEVMLDNEPRRAPPLQLAWYRCGARMPVATTPTHAPWPVTTTPSYPDSCGNVRGAMCTPAPGAVAACAVLVGAAVVARRRLRA